MPQRIQKHGQALAEVDKDNHDPTTTADQQTLIDGLRHDLAGEYPSCYRVRGCRKT